MALELRHRGPLTVDDLAELPDDGRRYDLLVKRDVYESFGVAGYWLVDPEEPSVTVLELDDDGVYREVARASGDDELVVSAPFPLAVVPAHLIR